MDDDMDMCEYMWSNEMAMRRLLNMLRHGQSYCTDTECIDLPSTHPGDVVSDGGNNFLMMTVLLAVAVMLYVMRPNTIRGNGRNQMSGNGKPARPNDDDSNSDMPPPPAVD